jgi:CRP/FNR family transcriptional regulator, cyclic AMP receptor protein
MRGNGETAHYVTDERLPSEFIPALQEVGRELFVRRGHILLAEESETTDVLFIADGAVQITLFSAEGQETILRTLPAGHIFGEMSALDGQPRSATVIALADTRLIRIPADAFNRFLREVPAAAHFIACLLTQRVRSLTAKLHELATLPMPRRLTSELLRIAQPVGEDGSFRITAFPTHAELAARISSQRESVSRELSQWKRAGWIRQSGRVVDIPSMAKLLAALHTGEG